jgi:hypothetical protein
MNKAHTATANRIARRYGLVYRPHARPDRSDPHAADLMGVDSDGNQITIEVETSATLADAVKRLATTGGRIYIAVTNKEALIDAVRLTKDTPLGVMDPRGDVVKECAELSFPSLRLIPSGGEAPTGGEGRNVHPRAHSATIPVGAGRRYNGSAGSEEPAKNPAAPAKNPAGPIHVASESRAPAFAIPDAPALPGALPVGFGRDGAGVPVG